jgi:hypothetical protein
MSYKVIYKLIISVILEGVPYQILMTYFFSTGHMAHMSVRIIYYFVVAYRCQNITAPLTS